jgi:hypothetical protein
MSTFKKAIADTQRVRVYKVEIYDIETDEMRLSRRMATQRGAEKMGGSIVQGTAVIIDPDQLERGEEWTPRDFKPE